MPNKILPVASISGDPFRTLHPIRRVQEVSDLGIETLICGALSGFVGRMFEHRGIRVFDWVVGDAREILLQYADRDPGTARRTAIPGSCRRGGKHGRRAAPARGDPSLPANGKEKTDER